MKIFVLVKRLEQSTFVDPECADPAEDSRSIVKLSDDRAKVEQAKQEFEESVRRGSGSLDGIPITYEIEEHDLA